MQSFQLSHAKLVEQRTRMTLINWREFQHYSAIKAKIGV